LKECSEAGTALVIDIVNQPWMCDWSDGEATSVEQPEKQQAAVIALAEVLGLDQDRLGQTLAHAQRIQGGFLVSYRPSCRRLELMEVGLSPHAPYSLQHPSGMERVDQLVRQHRSARPDLASPVIAMHLAESTDELHWLERAEGPMAELFRKAGLPLDQPRMQVDEAIQSLAKWGRGLVIHGNYLSERQLDRVAECGLAMVYCPRTHRFFGHRRYPIEAILDRGIPLLLGTDSRASNPDLSVWRECLAARQTNPALSAAKALQSVTTAAADYLGLSDRLGSLQTGRRAWVNTLPVPSSATNENLLDLILPSETGEYSAAQPQPVIWSSR
jgi:cytosine/adenosine deaminase-related metal-dependent hydrolase